MRDKPISVDDRLPEDRTYVLAHYNGGNWSDSDDPEGCVWKVCKFVRGLSSAEREAMADCERKTTFMSEDEWANNERPYCWTEFGPGNLFGQDVDFWLPIPSVP